MAEIPASHRDLLDEQTLTLATIDPAGRPQLTLVWFLAEDGLVRISLNTTRKKCRNLRRDPACSVIIVDPKNHYRYLEIRGTAEIEPDDDYAFADRLGAKYGADVRKMDGPGETRVVVTVRPASINPVNIGG
ncbi:MAG TPA: PPOX class F420-dependent oxidoreductase [Streptosporangiaceae bacterium]|nr:PPOX class F420-dependent oxidoreductase [Streptosporangiaceae bacterium]